jgi:hypothetical protein
VTMPTVAALVSVAVAVLALCSRYRPADRLSTRWLRDHQRLPDRFEGVSWDWEWMKRRHNG